MTEEITEEVYDSFPSREPINYQFFKEYGNGSYKFESRKGAKSNLHMHSTLVRKLMREEKQAHSHVLRGNI